MTNMSKQEDTTQTAGDEQADVTQETVENTEETQDTQGEEVTQETEEKSEDIDYKAILEEERKRREDAEKSAADYAYKLRNAKRDGEGGESEEAGTDDDAPLTRKELNEALQSFSQQNEKVQQETQAKQIIEKFTTGEDEAAAAYEMWKNKVVPTGDLESDIMFAIGGLNHKRVLATNEELKRSLTSKETKNRDASTSQRKSAGAEDTKTSGADAAALKAQGMKWNSEKQAYGKQLKDGKTFFYDPKTQKRWKE